MTREANTWLAEETYCGYCGRKLGDLGFYYMTCHVCGQSYCYIHVEQHSGTHPFRKNP